MHMNASHRACFLSPPREAAASWRRGPLRPQAQGPSLTASTFLPPHLECSLCSIPAWVSVPWCPLTPTPHPPHSLLPVPSCVQPNLVDFLD